MQKWQTSATVVEVYNQLLKLNIFLIRDLVELVKRSGESCSDAACKFPLSNLSSSMSAAAFTASLHSEDVLFQAKFDAVKVFYSISPVYLPKLFIHRTQHRLGSASMQLLKP